MCSAASSTSTTRSQHEESGFPRPTRVRPEGLRYASTRVVDSSTFVILTELAEGIQDPRPAIPEFLRFLDQLKGWVDGPPVIEHLDVVGSYDLFGTQREESAVR